MSNIKIQLLADREVVENIVRECEEALTTERCPEESDAIHGIMDECAEWLATVSDLRASGIGALRQFRKWAVGVGLPGDGLTLYIEHAQEVRDQKRAERARLAEEIALIEAHLAREKVARDQGFLLEQRVHITNCRRSA